MCRFKEAKSTQSVEHVDAIDRLIKSDDFTIHLRHINSSLFTFSTINSQLTITALTRVSLGSDCIHKQYSLKCLLT